MSVSPLLSPPDARWVAAGFCQLLPLPETIEPHLGGVIRDTLAHPGSLVRAQLVWSLLRRHGAAAGPARTLAVAVEYFHTASLIFDDLPAMDDARERRGHPCPHLLYGESAAILGALALVNRGYALLWKVLGRLSRRRRHRAAELVEACLGIDGILDGQAHDLHFAKGPHGLEAVRRVAEGKTVSLIRLTLVLPAIVAGVDPQNLARLERLATVWGLAYQAADDFKDFLLSEAEAGKSTGRDLLLGRPNLPAELGCEPALAALDALLAEGRELLGALADEGPPWTELENLQELLESETARVRERLSITV